MTHPSPRLLTLVLIGISIALIGCRTPLHPEKTIVTVNGTPIREKQITEEADRRINVEAAQSQSMGLIYDESQRPGTRQVMRDDVLHSLIERQLIADQLKADGIQITDAEVDARFLEKARALGQTVEEAEAEIQHQGKTIPDVKERLRWNTLGVEKLYEAHAASKRVLTEADARKIYTDAPAEYTQQNERRVSRILFNAPSEAKESVKKAAEAKAEEALRRIKAGEDFAEVAKRYSEDGATRYRGGDRGWSPRGFVTGAGSDPFGDVAFSMQNIGDVSDVVRTQDGYEIIKLTGIREARQKSFEEVKDQILARERHWDIGNFWQQFATDMRAKADIEWDPQENLRRDEKEKRDRAYNKKIEEQVARQEKRAAHKDWNTTKRPAEVLIQKPSTPAATGSDPLTSTAGSPAETSTVQ